MKYRFSGGEGTDSGGIPILEDSMRFVDSAINDKEAEWAESMRLTREDVAAAYHVNPSIVWSNDGQTYASTRVRECASAPGPCTRTRSGRCSGSCRTASGPSWCP